MSNNLHAALVSNVSDAFFEKTNRGRSYADKDALVAVAVFEEALIGLAADNLTVADLCVALGLAEDPYTGEPEAVAPVATEE